jgi:integrase
VLQFEEYARWHRTLRRLAIRYRKPYAARHTSVSWNLMLGRNPLWVARQHGHSISTMLWVYAAWIEGAAEVDLIHLREAMQNIRRLQSSSSPNYVEAPRVNRVEESESAAQELPRNMETTPPKLN